MRIINLVCCQQGANLQYGKIFKNIYTYERQGYKDICLDI